MRYLKRWLHENAYWVIPLGNVATPVLTILTIIITIIISISNMREIVLERHIEYYPDIVIDSGYCLFENSYLFRASQEETNDELQKFVNTQGFFEIKNIGNHAAKLCTFQWDANNIPNAKKMFKDVFDIEIDNCEEVYSHVYHDIPGQPLWDDLPKDTEFEYIMPFAQSSERTTYIEFPKPYIEIIYAYIRLKNIEIIKSRTEKFFLPQPVNIHSYDAPPISFNLTVTYYDMLGDKFTKHYVVEIDDFIFGRGYFLLHMNYISG